MSSRACLAAHVGQRHRYEFRLWLDELDVDRLADMSCTVTQHGGWYRLTINTRNKCRRLLVTGRPGGKPHKTSRGRWSDWIVRYWINSHEVSWAMWHLAFSHMYDETWDGTPAWYNNLPGTKAIPQEIMNG